MISRIILIAIVTSLSFLLSPLAFSAYVDLENDYTETDPGNDISWPTDSEHATLTTVVKNYDMYYYKNYTANYFGDTWHHDFEWKVTSTSGGWTALGGNAVTNHIDDHHAWLTDDDQAIAFRVFRNATGPQGYLQLNGCEDNVGDTYNPGETTGVQYYISMEKTSTTAVELRIYSDSSRTTLLDTLSLTSLTNRQHQYHVATNSINDGNSARDTTAIIGNFDLDAGGAPPAASPMQAVKNIF